MVTACGRIVADAEASSHPDHRNPAEPAEVSGLRLSNECSLADSRPKAKGPSILPGPFAFSFRIDRPNCFEDRFRFHHPDGGDGDGDCCCSAAGVLHHHRPALGLPLVPVRHQRG
jgi:hypothetical protein